MRNVNKKDIVNLLYIWNVAVLEIATNVLVEIVVDVWVVQK